MCRVAGAPPPRILPPLALMLLAALLQKLEELPETSVEEPCRVPS